jgi:hypothetical protein
VLISLPISPPTGKILSAGVFLVVCGWEETDVTECAAGMEDESFHTLSICCYALYYDCAVWTVYLGRRLL